MKRRLYTWHDESFDIRRGKLVQERSMYIETVSDLQHKYRHVNELVGHDQYLWCYCERAAHRWFEIGKEAEWVLDVDDEQIIGYIESSEWQNFLDCHRGRIRLLTFQPTTDEDCSALVAFPVDPSCVVGRIVYRIEAPKTAQVVRVEGDADLDEESHR